MARIHILAKVSSDKRQEFLQTFKLLSRPDKRPAGCMDQNLFEDVNEPNRFIWIENWHDSKALDAHMKTEQFSSLLGAIDVLGSLEALRTVELESEKV